MSKKKKTEEKPETLGFSDTVVKDEYFEKPEVVVEPTPKKQKEYKKTLHMGKDRFGNPRSQRDFESTLRNFLDGEESYKAWKTWSDGGTVTLIIKK